MKNFFQKWKEQKVNQKKPDPPQHRELLDLIRDYAGLSRDEGLLIGWQQTADFCVQLAGSLYMAGRDDEAALARQMGRDIRVEELRRREQFDKRRDELKDQKYGEIIGQIEYLEKSKENHR